MCNQITKRPTQKKWSDPTTRSQSTKSLKDSWFLGMTLLCNLKCGNPLWQTALSTLTTQHQLKKSKWDRLSKRNTTTCSLLTGDPHFNLARILSHGLATSRTHFWKKEMHLKTSCGTARTPVHWSLSLAPITMSWKQSSGTLEHFRENDGLRSIERCNSWLYLNRLSIYKKFLFEQFRLTWSRPVSRGQTVWR
jgi:hypothetical protein